MFIQGFLLFLLLFFLYLSSRKVATYIYKFIYLVIGSSRFSIALLAIIVLPGTLIHEFSHLVFATFLRVPTGNLTIMPSMGKKGEVKTGRLEIVKPDPFRHILIGLAPMIVGLIIIYVIGNYLLPSFSQLLSFQFSVLSIISLYLLFAMSVTMFSSRKDLESLIIAGPIIFLIGLSLYLFGIRIVFEESLVAKITQILSSLNYYLLISLVLDYLIFVFLTLCVSLLQKIFKRK